MEGPLVKRFDRVYIEIINTCNLACSFCPSPGKDAARMDVSTFQSILAQVAPLTNQVCLHLLGEPTNHPNFAQILEVCRDFSIPVQLTTNGVWRAGIAADILAGYVRQVNISLQSYMNNFPNRNCEPYLTKIASFVAQALEARPDLYINLRLWDMNSEGVGRPENKILRSWIETTFSATLPMPGDVRRTQSLRLVGRVYAHFDTRFEWPDQTQPFLGRTGTCRALDHHIGVLVDGTVVPCCLDRDGHISLGNLHVTPLHEILQGPKAIDMIEGFGKGELRQDVCQRCSFARRFTSPRKLHSEPNRTLV